MDGGSLVAKTHIIGSGQAKFGACDHNNGLKVISWSPPSSVEFILPSEATLQQIHPETNNSGDD